MSGRYEEPDPTPMEIPAGFKRPETLSEMVRRLVRGDLSVIAEQQGAETFEESEDFNIDEDEFPSSPYEEVFDPRLGRGITVEEFHKNYAEYEARWAKAQSEMERVAIANEVLTRRVRKAARLDEQSGPEAGQEVSKPVDKSNAEK